MTQSSQSQLSQLSDTKHQVMDADRLNRWLTLGANLGVLVGILLLIIELDQNRESIRGQTRNDLAEGAISVISLAVENPHLADALVRSNNGEEVTPAEAYMLASRAEAVLRYFENVHYQYRIGTYDEGEFSRHMDTMKAVVTNTVSVRKYWCQYGARFSATFEDAANAILGGDLCQ
jgi:hypothetical protein